MEQNNQNSELGKVQTVKVYLKDNISMMLFSELVAALNLPEMREAALREIVKRMEFCSIDQITAKRLIQVEKKVLENKPYNRPDMDYLIRKNWWEQKELLFNNDYSKIGLKSDHLSAEETLTSSDLVAISAEANYIFSINNKDELYSSEFLNEINDFAINKEKKLAMVEYQKRVNFCYVWAYKDANHGSVPSEEMQREVQVKAIKLFENEIRIITKYKYNSQAEDWEPYTEQYFNRENEKREKLQILKCEKCGHEFEVLKEELKNSKEYTAKCPNCSENFIVINEEYVPEIKLELKDIAINSGNIIKENKQLIDELYEKFKQEEIERDLLKFKNDKNLLINIVFVCVACLCRQEHTRTNMITTLEKVIDGANETDRLENQKENLQQPFNTFPEVFASLNPKTKYFVKKTIEEILEKCDNKIM